jgi:hypothetical protein
MAMGIDAVVVVNRLPLRRLATHFGDAGRVGIGQQRANFRQDQRRKNLIDDSFSGHGATHGAFTSWAQRCRWRLVRMHDGLPPRDPGSLPAIDLSPKRRKCLVYSECMWEGLLVGRRPDAGTSSASR